MSERSAGPILRLARPEDEPELRRLTALPMQGKYMDLRYCREPSYFAGLNDPNDHVLLARLPFGPPAAPRGPFGPPAAPRGPEDGGEGPAVCMLVRSLRQTYVNGVPTRLGQLSGLRVDPAYEGSYLLFSGYRLLRQIEAVPLEDGTSQVDYLATIVEGNQRVEQVLVEKRRPQWHRFVPYGRLCTLALAVGPRYSMEGLQLDPPAAQVDSFMRQYGPSRQFFPVWDPQAATWEDCRWLAHDGGVVALRDLSRYRQTVVHRYRPPLNWLRPFYNFWSWCLGRPGLPPTGYPLSGAYAGYFCLRPDRRGRERGGRGEWGQSSPWGHAWSVAFQRLLEGLLELCRRAGKSWLYLGLLDDDPNLALARRYRHVLYRSAVYHVISPGGKGLELDGRPGYVELASL